ncbi:hypothetical protein GWK08_16685 [Leptobacterium flavescens]|uniref:DUF2262 domain-containing protein n=1 Tax=Leptobacterium flavescens TaxID=472055 RepID=A0A6P0UWF2_9FLAO|nr:hypothetical protein [Leptobacterium flavescens]NER15093.1 hypothetical protein [Leptobacterium flavescens]
MGIFGKLFGSKKIKITDPDFGEIESVSVRGNKVDWQVLRKFLGSDIEILIEGDQNGISETQKQVLLNALNNETQIRSEAEKALKEQYDNAEMEFLSIEDHFDVKAISVEENGFELTFQEKEGQNYYFNVYFENNKQIGVSIDG